jgi:hypothetical protein
VLSNSGPRDPPDPPQPTLRRTLGGGERARSNGAVRHERRSEGGAAGEAEVAVDHPQDNGVKPGLIRGIHAHRAGSRKSYPFRAQYPDGVPGDVRAGACEGVERDGVWEGDVPSLAHPPQRSIIPRLMTVSV